MIYILIPVYNEESNIQNLYSELRFVLPASELYFVFSDDGSTDESVETIKYYFKELRHVILGDGTNRGPGAVFNTGLEWILKDSKDDRDVIVTMEADCTSDAGILENMIAISRLGYDLVLASVYMQGGGFDKTSFLRKFLSSTANLFYRFLFNIRVLTLSSFYRVYSIGLLKKLKKKYDVLIEEPGFICMLEILVKAVDSRSRIIEVPMVLSSHKRLGNSKMKVWKTTLAYFRFLFTLERKYS